MSDSSLISGLPAGKLLSGKKTFFREDNGLERLVQEYYCRTDELQNFPFVNGTPYGGVYAFTIESQTGPSISAVVPQVSGAGYNYMMIERTDFESKEGGVTLAKITYVGLFSTSIPTPKVEYAPVLDTRYIHNRFYVRVNFVCFLGKPGSEIEKNLISTRFSNSSRGGLAIAPANINEQMISYGKVSSYSLGLNAWKARFDVSEGAASLRWNTCDLFGRVPTGQIVDNQEELADAEATINYFGFIVTNMTIQRYGIFGVVSLELKEAASVQGFSSVVGLSGSTNCISTLNFSV